MKKYLGSIVFWGALWGLTEATLGYVLHSLSLGVGWLIWFPLAYFFINSVYRKTNSLYSIIFSSFLAASIKLVDFVMPTSPDRIINPAVSIIFEGLAVFALFKISEGRRDADQIADQTADHGAAQPGYIRYPGYPGVLLASLGWRILYILYMLLMPESFASISPLRSGSALLSFLGVEAVTNSLLIYGPIKIYELIAKKAMRPAGQPAVGIMKCLKLQDILNNARSSGFDGILKAAFTCLILAAALLAQWKL